MESLTIYRGNLGISPRSPKTNLDRGSWRLSALGAKKARKEQPLSRFFRTSGWKHPNDPCKWSTISQLQSQIHHISGHQVVHRSGSIALPNSIELSLENVCNGQVKFKSLIGMLEARGSPNRDCQCFDLPPTCISGLQEGPAERGEVTNDKHPQNGSREMSTSFDSFHAGFSRRAKTPRIVNK